MVILDRLPSYSQILIADLLIIPIPCAPPKKYLKIPNPKLLKATNGIFVSSPGEIGVGAVGVGAVGVVAIGLVATTGVAGAVGAGGAGVQTGTCGGICGHPPNAAAWLGGQGGLGCQCRKVLSNVNLFSLQLIVFTNLNISLCLCSGLVMWNC